MHPAVISVEAAIAMTERSRSTWWRRISKGDITRVADDARGRAMLLWAEVVTQITTPMESVDINVILRADAGEAAAQSDIGQFFSNAGKHKIALYWLQQAAQQDDSDAMQWLGRCYVSGDGVAKDDNLGLMWIAKAAAHGHIIANAQIKGFCKMTVQGK